MYEKRIVKGIALIGILSTFMGMTAFAVLDIDGGKWDYGYKNLYLTVYSKYYHPNQIHGSSVDGAWFDSDYNIKAGLWSNASADAAISDNHCYYCLGERSAVRGVELPDVETLK